MPITRDQASRLLTQPEMGLFGDSRNPALRALTEKALASRVARTRKQREKSRDLLQRQKLKSRENTGSKLGASGVANVRTAKKGEILDDMLQRFETRLREVQIAGHPPKQKRGAASAKMTRSGNDTSNAMPKTTRATSKKAITPKRALQNTRALLEAKQKRDREPPAYLTMNSHAGIDQPSPEFQSADAKSQAQELHEAEMRMEPVHGSISTHNRKNQGKRDQR